MWVRLVFFAVGFLALAGCLSPPVALACGVAFGFACTHPYPAASRRWSRWLLQLSVVGLGFGLSFAEVIATGSKGLLWTASGIISALTLGMLLGKWLHVRPRAAFLISAGTAICGGSAIAALAPILRPDDDELAVSLGTVFTLNAAALLLFPLLGAYFHLSQEQFGLWAALAIHDTSSVVGAAARYGTHALVIATVVKLTRALWIVPLSLAVACLRQSQARVKLPFFILLFCLAALTRSLWPHAQPVYAVAVRAAHGGLALTLFLIGTEINARTLQQCGRHVLLQGLLLWVMVAAGTLAAIRGGWIHL